MTERSVSQSLIDRGIDKSLHILCRLGFYGEHLMYRVSEVLDGPIPKRHVPEPARLRQLEPQTKKRKADKLSRKAGGLLAEGDALRGLSQSTQNPGHRVKT